ncbi:hypothetical protein HDU84_003667 [Entophlyctis sp. JEL0112]|nr:hypothetical protein HDU84_003667 [Entophlyctis sp. JEL0112]
MSKWFWQNIVVDALTAVLSTACAEPAERVLKRTLRRGQSILNNTERVTIARMLFGASCLRRRIEYRLQHVRRTTSEVADADVHIVKVLTVYKIFEECVYFPHATEPASSWLEFASVFLDDSWMECLRETKHTLIWPTDRIAFLEAFFSFPDWLARAVIEVYPSSEVLQNSLAASMNHPARPMFRTNLKKISRLDLAESLAKTGIHCEPTVLSESSLRVTGQEKPEIRNNPLYRTGLFEVQDEGSQLVSLATGAGPGMTVLDMCCGRGGKALHLADMMGRGLLVCHDVDEVTLSQAKSRIKKADLSSDLTVRFVCSTVGERSAPSSNGGRGGDVAKASLNAAKPAFLPPDFAALSCALEENLADVVLVDAPCSSLGTLRRGPNVRWEINPESLSIFPGLQQNILTHACKLVKIGGVLVYATCTFNKEECGNIREWFQTQYCSSFIPVPLASWFSGDVPQCLLESSPNVNEHNFLQLAPSTHDTDAFFIAKWKRAK